jgi:hypothetical protein
MIVHKTSGGGARVFLHAREGITPEQATKIRKALETAQMACVPTEVDGKLCLEVRGSKSYKGLEKALKPTGLIKGGVSIDNSDESKFSIKEFTRNNMVFIYGVINVIADIGMIGYGRMMQKLSPGKDAWEEKYSGYSYSAGSIAFTAFGRGDKSDYHARDIAIALRQEMQSRGIDIGKESAAASFASIKDQQGFFKKSQSFLSKGGSDAGNIATGMAGGLIALGAYNNKKKSDPKDRMVEAALGTTTFLSGMGAALVKEKLPDKDNPPTTTLGKVKQWIQERPNRLAGYGYMVSTAAHAYQAYDGHKKAHIDYPANAAYAKTAYKLRGAFAGLNFLGEIILASASKGHGSGVLSDNGVEDTALAMVADTIVRRPREERDTLIHDLATNFLANPNVLGGDAEILQAKLHERVHRLRVNPWSSSQFKASAPSKDVKNATANSAGEYKAEGKTWSDGTARDTVKALANAAQPTSHTASALEKQDQLRLR